MEEAASHPFSGLAFLESLTHRAMVLGVERIVRFLGSLGNPHYQVKAIHVTGTNGKGSVCAFLTAIWRHVGARVGCFTSPHLVDWRESITVDNQMISVLDFDSVLQSVEEQMKRTRIPLTQFEALTAAAFLHFHQQRVDLSVIEVGLGGEHDATNVLQHPLASIITSISLDHMEVLGHTIEAIAQEKAGIIKRRRPVLVSSLVPASALAVIEQVACAKESPLHVISPARWDLDPDGHEIALFVNKEGNQDVRYCLGLFGHHQLSNSALALATVLCICGENQEVGTFNHNPRWNTLVQVVNDSEGQAQLLRRGIEQVRWPGRLQWLFFRNRRILLDGSHNAEAGLQLRQFVEKSVLPSLRMEEMRNPTLVEREVWVQWVVGMLGHKDHSAYLRSILCPTYPPDAKGGLMSQDISFIEVKPNVGWLEPFPPTRLLGVAQEVIQSDPSINLRSCQAAPSLEHILDKLDQQEAVGEPLRNMVVVCGSLHLCGQVLSALPLFDLLETMRWERHSNGGGGIGNFILLGHHLERLERALLFTGFCIEPSGASLLINSVREQLYASAMQWAAEPPLVRRVRVCVDAQGHVKIQSAQIDPGPILLDLAPFVATNGEKVNADLAKVSSLLRTVKVRLAQEPVLRDDPFLRCKTTHRDIYTNALRVLSGGEGDDVILFNQFGQITESAVANLAIVRLKDETQVEVITAPVECGLLGGTLRRALVEGGWMKEADRKSVV